LDLEANWQIIEGPIEKNLENGKKYARFIKKPISKFDVGQRSFENKGKAYGAQVVSTTRCGMTWNMDWGSLEKA